MGYNSVADIIGLSSFIQPWLPPKVDKWREIQTKFDLTAVQGHPRSSILVSIESLCTTSYQSLIVTLAVSATVFDILTLKAKQESPAVADNPARCESMPKFFQFVVLTTLSLTILVYPHSFSCCCVRLRNLRNPQKFSENSNLQSSRSFKVIDLGFNRKRVCNFLLVIVTLDVSPTVLEILTHLATKQLVFPTPTLFDAAYLRNGLQYQQILYIAVKYIQCASRVIADFVSNFVAMATGVIRK